LWRLSLLVAAMSSTAAMPPISPQARAALDRALGAKGVYVEEESAYKFAFPRLDIGVQVGRQQLSPAQAPVLGHVFTVDAPGGRDERRNHRARG
jgi:hypothetical protein